MIFVGDVSIAAGDRFRFEGFPDELCRQPLCLNLEGAVNDGTQVPDWGVYNAPDWVESFRDFTLGPVFSANNHIHDTRDGVRATQASLAALGLRSFGAGTTPIEAALHVTASSGSHAYALLGCGWHVIGCRVATERTPGVNPLEGNSLRQQAAAALRAAPGHRVVVVLHGNYEFERYPQPGHRRLAMELVDLGVHAVVFHHPHIVGPVERYRDRPIAYSLGNWAFSYGRFFGGRLRLPETSFQQVALELGDGFDTVHHVRFSPPSTVIYERAESLEAADHSLRPAFEGLSHADYVSWFRHNRVKRLGLPIYRSADSSVGNTLRDAWVAARQRLVDAAAKRGLKPMRRSA